MSWASCQSGSHHGSSIPLDRAALEECRGDPSVGFRNLKFIPCIFFCCSFDKCSIYILIPLLSGIICTFAFSEALSLPKKYTSYFQRLMTYYENLKGYRVEYILFMLMWAVTKIALWTIKQVTLNLK